MALETATQCDWVSLLTSGTLIPASAFVAIFLFIIRELLDCRRKSKARKNEIRALKQIFARECQVAWHINGQIKKLCETFEPYEKKPQHERILDLQVFKTTAGKTRYIVLKSGRKQSGGLLPEPSTENFSRFLYDVSKTDSVFYEKMDAAFKAIVELKHFYDSIVDNKDSAQIIEIENIMIGFSGYALKEITWIEENLRALYQFCTGEELTEGLLR
ncbi:hypothetical protein ACUWQO_003589 [Escherichia coli]|nr:hypothetical protein [Escherichia coli]EFK6852038.1 hypothetical protein [Escherichia coli]EGA3980578.1 hypothetical protein [Escherichia coli]HBA7660174.1 hypothetical protein [Escherichia coli]HCB4114194.1 hypothetical protein [Escherichia coli]